FAQFAHLLRQPSSTLFPYPTLFRSEQAGVSSPRVPPHSREMSSSRTVAGADRAVVSRPAADPPCPAPGGPHDVSSAYPQSTASRSEEHTSELQSRENLVCRLLLETT